MHEKGKGNIMKAIIKKYIFILIGIFFMILGVIGLIIPVYSAIASVKYFSLIFPTVTIVIFIVIPQILTTYRTRLHRHAPKQIRQDFCSQILHNNGSDGLYR